MMAKMFYTLEETKAALGKSEDEIRQFARDGRLREFRDGPRLMFKADQVEALKAEIGGGGSSIGLAGGPTDGSGAPIGLASDTHAPPSSGTLTLADTGYGKSTPTVGSSGSLVASDSSLGADLGLSGSVSGVPSPGRASPVSSGSGLSGTAGGKSTGITVFEPDDAHVDPSAQTAIGAGVRDQVNLDGVGSGSGLLDLTREADDTSLGAELLDEIGPSSAPARRGGAAPALGDDLGGGGGADRGRAAGPQAPIYVEAPDPLATAFGWLALFGTIVTVAVSFVLANALAGVRPEFVAKLSGKGAGGNSMLYLGCLVFGGLLFFVIGWGIGKAGSGSKQ